MFSLSINFPTFPLANVGSIYVRLDKGEYAPGEQVTGTVLLDLLSNFGSNQIWLTLVGVEQVRLVQETTTGTGAEEKKQHHPKYEDNWFFSHKIPIYTFPNAFVPGGQYSIPFSFMLGPGLPSTFRYEFKMHGFDCFASTNYELMASLESVGLGAQNLRHTTTFNVNQPVVVGDGSQKKELTQNVTSCCCFGKGSSKITTYFEKSDYIPGETAYLITEADNTQCTVKVEKISARFRQNLTLQAQGFTHRINHDLNVLDTPGIGPGEKKDAQNAIRLAVPLVASNNRGIIQPTSRGKLIVNEYELANYLHMDACICCSDHPNCVLNLNVRNPSITYSNWSSQPPTWNPQKLSPITFTLDAGFMMPRPDRNQAQQSGMPGMPGMAGMPGMPNPF
jgi:Arrestin (or S-antigen), N-terminal domain